jgi:hypothetical protein
MQLILSLIMVPAMLTLATTIALMAYHRRFSLRLIFIATTAACIVGALFVMLAAVDKPIY